MSSTEQQPDLSKTSEQYVPLQLNSPKGVQISQFGLVNQPETKIGNEVNPARTILDLPDERSRRDHLNTVLGNNPELHYYVADEKQRAEITQQIVSEATFYSMWMMHSSLDYIRDQVFEMVMRVLDSNIGDEISSVTIATSISDQFVNVEPVLEPKTDSHLNTWIDKAKKLVRKEKQVDPELEAFKLEYNSAIKLSELSTFLIRSFDPDFPKVSSTEFQVSHRADQLSYEIRHNRNGNEVLNAPDIKWRLLQKALLALNVSVDAGGEPRVETTKSPDEKLLQAARADMEISYNTLLPDTTKKALWTLLSIGGGAVASALTSERLSPQARTIVSAAIPLFFVGLPAAEYGIIAGGIKIKEYDRLEGLGKVIIFFGKGVGLVNILADLPIKKIGGASVKQILLAAGAGFAFETVRERIVDSFSAHDSQPHSAAPDAAKPTVPAAATEQSHPTNTATVTVMATPSPTATEITKATAVVALTPQPTETAVPTPVIQPTATEVPVLHALPPVQASQIPADMQQHGGWNVSAFNQSESNHNFFSGFPHVEQPKVEQHTTYFPGINDSHRDSLQPTDTVPLTDTIPADTHHDNMFGRFFNTLRNIGKSPNLVNGITDHSHHGTEQVTRGHQTGPAVVDHGRGPTEDHKVTSPEQPSTNHSKTHVEAPIAPTTSENHSEIKVQEFTDENMWKAAEKSVTHNPDLINSSVDTVSITDAEKDVGKWFNQVAMPKGQVFVPYGEHAHVAVLPDRFSLDDLAKIRADQLQQYPHLAGLELNPTQRHNLEVFFNHAYQPDNHDDGIAKFARDYLRGDVYAMHTDELAQKHPKELEALIDIMNGDQHPHDEMKLTPAGVFNHELVDHSNAQVDTNVADLTQKADQVHRATDIPPDLRENHSANQVEDVHPGADKHAAEFTKTPATPNTDSFHKIEHPASQDLKPTENKDQTLTPERAQHEGQTLHPTQVEQVVSGELHVNDHGKLDHFTSLDDLHHLPAATAAKVDEVYSSMGFTSDHPEEVKAAILHYANEVMTEPVDTALDILKTNHYAENIAKFVDGATDSYADLCNKTGHDPVTYWGEVGVVDKTIPGHETGLSPWRLAILRWAHEGDNFAPVIVQTDAGVVTIDAKMLHSVVPATLSGGYTHDQLNANNISGAFGGLNIDKVYLTEEEFKRRTQGPQGN